MTVLYRSPFVFILLFAFGSIQAFAQSDSELNEVRNTQIEVKTSASQFIEQLRPIFAELAELGATRDDISVIEDTITTLQQLDSNQMSRIISALDGAISAPDSSVARQRMTEALEGQDAVEKVLREIFERLRVRRGELERASRAESLRSRQSENHHRTEKLKDGEGDRDLAEAEQKAIEEAVRQLTEDMAASREEGATSVSETPSEAENEKMDRMKELAKKASDALAEENYDEAAQAQERLEEMLNDIAAEAGREPASSDFLQDVLAQLNDLLNRQRALIGDFSNREMVYAEQDAIAVATNAMIVSVQGVSAPSGFQVESAAQAMRRAMATMSAGDPTVHQRTAVKHLELAVQRLEGELKKVGGPSDASEGSIGNEAESDENSSDDEVSTGESENSGENESSGNESESENSESNPSGESEQSESSSESSESDESDPSSESERASEQASDGSDKPGDSNSSDAGSESKEENPLEELERLYAKANELRNRQKAQADQPSSKSEQQAIARETAELQSDVLAQSPETARELGRAAVRMAESMNSELSPEEQASLRAEAAEALSEASETLLAEGRQQYSEQQSDSQSASDSPSDSESSSDRLSDSPSDRLGLGEYGGNIVDNASEAEFRGEVFGDVELSPADRSAIESARSEPVSPTFAPMVESYYEKLSKLSAE